MHDMRIFTRHEGIGDMSVSLHTNTRASSWYEATRFSPHRKNARRVLAFPFHFRGLGSSWGLGSGRLISHLDFSVKLAFLILHSALRVLGDFRRVMLADATACRPQRERELFASKMEQAQEDARRTEEHLRGLVNRLEQRAADAEASLIEKENAFRALEKKVSRSLSPARASS